MKTQYKVEVGYKKKYGYYVITKRLVEDDWITFSLDCDLNDEKEAEKVKKEKIKLFNKRKV
jgi:hypothetical protein